MPRRRNLNETWPMARQGQRLRELVVYISRKSEPDPFFGAIKLNKILYHSDFEAFRRFGVPLTGCRYSRLKFGPAPKAVVYARDDLVQEGAIRTERVRIGNFEQIRTIAQRDAVLDLFTPDEIMLVDEVIDRLWPQNATEVSDASHDVRWKVLRNNDAIPYEFAFLSNDPVSEYENKRTLELAAKYGWG